MIVLGLDPGTEKSSLVCFDGRTVWNHWELSNPDMLDHLKYFIGAAGQMLVIEQVESFGMAVGKEVFETVFWSGRFAQGWTGTFDRLPRRIVKQHLCHSSKANDGNIRQALIDRFGPSKEVAIGRKSAQGPLYGITGHKMAALAVAVTYYDLHAGKPEEIRPGLQPEF